MSAKRVELALAAIFLVVGILATSNMIRINRYISQTLPRDQQQEQCNADTLAVLKRWVVAREARDNAMDARDDAAIGILDYLIAGEKVPPEELQAYRDAITNAGEVRRSAREELVPLPNCEVK
jgi:hypothetical protein